MLLVLGILLCCGTYASAAERETPVTGSRFVGLDPFDKLMTDFVKEHDVPGASLAVTRNGHLVYARGFGFADREHHQAVQPQSLFRIASISKPFTSAAIMQLVEKGKLRLDDHPFELLHLTPHLASGGHEDPRLNKITILQLLQHTGGFDRDKSFDPMFRPIIIAHALGVTPPAQQRPIIRYMMGRELDFDPGTREVYSNFGYCVLGRVIEQVSGEPYEKYVREHVLAPLNISSMRLGHTLAKDRAPGEVVYYDEKDRTGGSVFPPRLGEAVPLPYGAWNIEAMDSHGGWIASAVDLVRFASSFDDPAHSKILSPRSIETTFARPPGAVGQNPDGKPKAVYYGCGWQVRHVGNGRINTWHNGSLDGTSTLLVRRADGLCWAVLFNTRKDQHDKELAGEIDGLVHKAADEVKQWPQGDLFDRY
ncbi:MAG TPA: serine hydrolase domain-containing protein [Humisphaera sp.]|nr:serine hydrolase domain-containing protein [Humisphaera sp.]